MCASVPPLSLDEVKDAMNIVRMMAEHLELFMDGIDAHYGRFPQIAAHAVHPALGVGAP